MGYALIAAAIGLGLAFILGLPCSASAEDDFEIGLKLRVAGKTEQAAEVFSRLCNRLPRNVSACIQQGAALEDLGKWDESRKCYERALAIDPRNRAARANLQRLKASRDVNRLASADNPTKRLLTRLAVRAMEEGDYAEALSKLRLVGGLAPDDPTPDLLIGLVWEKAGKADKALSAYKETARRFPDFPPPHVNMIVLLVRLGRHKDAAEACKTALEKFPDNRRLSYLSNLLGRPVEKRSRKLVKSSGSQAP